MVVLCFIDGYDEEKTILLKYSKLIETNFCLKLSELNFQFKRAKYFVENLYFVRSTAISILKKHYVCVLSSLLFVNVSDIY